MARFDPIDLPWLPPVPDDFRKKCRALGKAGGEGGGTARHLAGFGLNAMQSTSLSRSIGKQLAKDNDMAPLSAFRLGVLSSATTDLLADCLPAAAARHGVALTVVECPYDQVMQQALDPGSIMNGSGLDAVLLRVDHLWLQLDHARLKGDYEDAVSNAIGQVETVVSALRDNGGAATIIETVPVPPSGSFGSFEPQVPGSVRAMIGSVNRWLVEFAGASDVYLLDTASLAERIGTDRWFDPVAWNAFKLPFAAEAGPLFADWVGRMLGAIRGKSRKCLVLDLDNTCWGGVIGDDGMEGIKIGQGSALGEAFLSVQNTALALRDRGIMLAVSSKNTDEVAREPFRSHPDMALREDDITVFQANWTDKASNLEAIAKALNIGLDALVFLDDNPAERAQLRAALPMVAVPELPNDPSLYPAYLLAAGYFETVAFSNEDRIRAQSYAGNAKRAEVQAKSRNLGEYLASLEMRMTATPFDLQGRQRITQLVNKTNQFNLTTRRYSESEITNFEEGGAAWTLQVRLEDKFGDMGMIGVIICRAHGVDGDTWDIDSWLMSCRVLGRQIEEAMLAELVAGAKAAGISKLVGRYVRTPKNDMVSSHYEKLGFDAGITQDNGDVTFRLDIGAYETPDLPISIRRAGDPAPA